MMIQWITYSPITLLKHLKLGFYFV